MENNIILFPEIAALKAEVKRLRIEISMLLLEKDELQYVICKNIEAAYMLSVGSLEYKAFELNCIILRLKRKIELIQAGKNRQEEILLSDIESVLDREFESFQRQLNEQIDKMNQALDWNNGQILSEDETKEIKKLYRKIVKALHPDLHPEVTPAQLQLFFNAVQAYKNGDLKTLRVIGEMLSEPESADSIENSASSLQKEKEKLSKMLEHIQEQIASIKSDYPYTMKELVNDPDRISQRRAELEDLIAQLRQVREIYESRLNEMLR